MDKSSSLEPLEQALLQILMNEKVVESKVMEKHLEHLKVDYRDQDPDLGVTDIFSRLNERLKKLSLEIKTVVMRQTKGMIVEGEEVASEEEEEEEEEQEKRGEEQENGGIYNANKDVNALTDASSSSSRRTKPHAMVTFHCVANCSDDHASMEFGSTFSDVEFQTLREIIGIIVEHGRIGAYEISNIQTIKDKTKKGALMDALIIEKWLVRDRRGFFEIGPRSYVEIRNYIEGEMARCNMDLTTLPQILFY